MSEFKFQKGDRVVVARPGAFDILIGIKEGDAGEVLEDSPLLIYVCMDKFNKKLITLGGLCEEGHGWAFDQEKLELEEK